MQRAFFLKTERIEFSKWSKTDIELARLLWGNPQVTQYICANGRFTENEIESRLHTEILNDFTYGVQYWPIFDLAAKDLIGCCGLRPHGSKSYEIGFHLHPAYWGKGYAQEAATAVMEYAFVVLKAEKLFAGHHPNNLNSQRLLMKLGFSYIGDEFYAPTGLLHPSYEMKNPALRP